LNILVTGGYGFIGSTVIRKLISKIEGTVVNIDNLTYAANPNSLNLLDKNSNYVFYKGDICDKKIIEEVFSKYQPTYLLNLAAESHVDRSIDSPDKFIQTNINGTFNLLECSRKYWEGIKKTKGGQFRFHHISTDEVFGSLGESGLFDENSKYNPSSPYSASKASSDHLVRSWHRTYGLPTSISNCSNNYGPYQNPEKLIPRIILNAINGDILPIYGNGLQKRDWLYVDDHADALYQILINGKEGETYNVGGNNENTNLEIVEKICTLLDLQISNKPNNIKSFKELIKFVPDRPGHDYRYGINAKKLKRELGWEAKTTIDYGIEKTVKWYLRNLHIFKDYSDKIYNRKIHKEE
tara:strand:- start:34 stop:1092 length:1059 start_codon:yes stop_codon:yes gene_type:complete